MEDNYYLDIILKGYEESLRAIQLEETFASFESRSTLLNMGSTKYSDAEFYQIWINSNPIKTLIERIGKDEFINYEAKSRVKVEAWSKLANFFDSQQKITEREYFITNTEFFKNCLNTIDTLILNLKKIDGNTESIFYYEGVQGSLTDKAGKGTLIGEGFPYCNEINSFVFIRWHIKNTLKNAYKIEQDLLTPQKPQQPETTPLTLSDTTKNKHGINRALTNEIYYEVIIQGHMESLDAFTCSYKDAEYDHEHTVELFNNPRLGYEKQFKTLDDFILYRKQSTLNHKAYYRFWLYIESQQKIFERNYFVDEINFYIRCIDAISIKIDLEIEKYTNFIPLSKRGENGGVITEGNRFNRLVDSLVYYRIHFEDKVNSLNNNLLLESVKTPKPLDLSDTSTIEKKIIIIKEKNSEMFSNNGFELFEYILNEHVKPKETKGRKSDLIYYYWEMYNSNPQYIHQRPAPFFNWFDKEYNETTGQLKTYDNVKTPQRIKDYSTALEWFKSKNK